MTGQSRCPKRDCLPVGVHWVVSRLAGVDACALFTAAIAPLLIIHLYSTMEYATHSNVPGEKLRLES